MKISEASYRDLRKACLDTLESHNLHSDMVKTNRDAWDVMWKAIDEGRFIINTLYLEGLNDNHITTALRNIFK
jgi:hypothetical protein